MQQEQYYEEGTPQNSLELEPGSPQKKLCKNNGAAANVKRNNQFDLANKKNLKPVILDALDESLDVDLKNSRLPVQKLASSSKKIATPVDFAKRFPPAQFNVKLQNSKQLEISEDEKSLIVAEEELAEEEQLAQEAVETLDLQEQRSDLGNNGVDTLEKWIMDTQDTFKKSDTWKPIATGHYKNSQGKLEPTFYAKPIRYVHHVNGVASTETVGGKVIPKTRAYRLYGKKRIYEFCIDFNNKYKEDHPIYNRLRRIESDWEKDGNKGTTTMVQIGIHGWQVDQKSYACKWNWEEDCMITLRKSTQGFHCLGMSKDLTLQKFLDLFNSQSSLKYFLDLNSLAIKKN